MHKMRKFHRFQGKTNRIPLVGTKSRTTICGGNARQLPTKKQAWSSSEITRTSPIASEHGDGESMIGLLRFTTGKNVRPSFKVVEMFWISARSGGNQAKISMPICRFF
ncbi:hypothetical protein C1H46_008764 [Malus baccata]|uniref:Uncharacterized protein n=1 Tax=Malus baccata TaxID=106549 RepID=A0A540N3K9_MALBA|nr:hypothetical protein C1H46_008764 [Malus baccata]